MDNFTMVMKAKEMYEKENDFEGFLHKAYEIAGKVCYVTKTKRALKPIRNCTPP